MRDTVRQMMINTASGWLSVLGRSALAFFLVPFLLRHLGRSSFGLVGLLMALLTFAEVADLGLRQALGRDLAEQVARKDRQRFNALASSAFLLYLLTGILLAMASIVAAPGLVHFFKVPAEWRILAMHAIRIFGAGSFLLSFGGAVFAAALVSGNRFDLRSHIEVGSRIATGVALFAILPRIQNGLLGWVWITLAGQALGVALMAWTARKTIPWMRIAPSLAGLEPARSLLHLGWKVYILQLTHLSSEKMDPLFISRFLGPAGIALYTPGTQLAGMFRPILLTLAAQLHPLATHHHVENAQEKQRRMLTDGTRFTLLLGSLFSTGLFVFAEPFCSLWVGHALGADSRIVVLVVQFWAVADFLACMASVQWPMLLGTRNLNTYMMIEVAATMLNIALSVYFIGFTSLGVAGAVLGTVLTGMVLRPVLIVYGARVFNTPLLAFCGKALARPLLVTVLLLPAACAIRDTLYRHGYLSLLFCAALMTLCWIILMTGIALTREERRLACSRLIGRIQLFSRRRGTPGDRPSSRS